MSQEASSGTIWRRFWFDGNKYSEYIESPEDWKELVRAYDGDIRLLRGALSCHSDPEAGPNFGFRSEHTELPTLGQWADANGMDLSIRFGWLGRLERLMKLLSF